MMFVYILCIFWVNNSSKMESSTGGNKPKGPHGNLDSGSKLWWCKMQKKTGAMAKESIQSKDFSYIFLFLLFKDIQVGGWITHPKNISQVGSWKPPPRSDICIVYLSQKEVTSIDQPLHLTPATVPPGLSVEISHQTWSLSSFLSDKIHWKHWQPF